MAKQRILIFSTAYLPFIGGAELAVKEITDRVFDIDFDLITARLNPRQPKTERVGNVQVHRLGIGIPIFDKICLAFFGHRRALKLHALHKYHGVWAIMASHGGLAAEQFCSLTKVPYLLTLQEGDPLDEIQKKMNYFAGRFSAIFKNAKLLQPISQYLLDWGKKSGFSGATAVVVPNGVDYARFNHFFPVAEMIEVRDRLMVPPEARLCVTVSRLVVKNGLAALIQAFQYLPPEIHLVICGVGPEEKALRRLAETKENSGRIHFMGLVNHQLLPLVLKTCEVFIRPSVSEGLGNAFLESMAAGLTTIGTPVGGIPDFLKDGVTGFMTDANNPTQIAATLKKALNMDKHSRHVMHESAREMIKQKYTWDVVAEQMKELFKHLCAS